MALAEPGTDEVITQFDVYYYSVTLTSNTETITNTEIAIVPDGSSFDEDVWGIWWPVHRYFFGALFLLLSIYALYATILRVMNNRRRDGIRSRKAVQPVFTCINLLVFVLGSSNAIMLFLDPYLKYQRIPVLAAVILFNMPYPCMTSAFSLVLWVLLSISKMRISKSAKLRSACFLSAVIASHFILVLLACFVFVFYKSVLILGVLCHGFFVGWGVLLSVTYIYSARKILSVAKKNRKELQDISMRDGSITTNGGSKVSHTFPKRLSAIFARSMKRPNSASNKTSIYSISRNQSSPKMPPNNPTVTVGPDCRTCLPVIDDISSDSKVNQEQIQINDTMTSQSMMTASEELSNSETKTRDTEEQSVANQTKMERTDEHYLSTTGSSILTAASTNPLDKNKDGAGNNITALKKNHSVPSDAKQNRSKRKLAGKMSSPNRPQVTQKVFRIASLTAALGLTSSCLGLYGILGLMVAGPDEQPPPWGWYFYQSCARYMCFQ
ncbi:uncharacterized protein [Asterias amurensis]|uniref:uncharacterized protein n=1 Tax=Asterias amurensis TaxID=7602 RepID=UPI003AB6F26F